MEPSSRIAKECVSFYISHDPTTAIAILLHRSPSTSLPFLIPVRSILFSSILSVLNNKRRTLHTLTIALPPIENHSGTTFLRDETPISTSHASCTFEQDTFGCSNHIWLINHTMANLKNIPYRLS